MASPSRVSAGLALTLALAPGAPASAAGPRDRCQTPGRQTVRVTGTLRLFTKGGDATYACVRASGRVTRLFEADGIYRTGAILDAAGRRVAYSLSAVPECKADCPLGVGATFATVVIDAVTRRRRTLTREPVAGLVLATSGTVAWLTGSATAAELHLADRAGRRLLDSGEIPARSLKASGGRLAWTNAGRPRSAAFA